jgi:hypothetical protein
LGPSEAARDGPILRELCAEAEDCREIAAILNGLFLVYAALLRRTRFLARLNQCDNIRKAGQKRQRPSAVEKAYWPCHNEKMSVTNAPVEFTVTVLPSNRRLGTFTCIEHPGTFAKELKDFVLLHKRIANLRPDGSLYLPEAPSVAEVTP